MAINAPVVLTTAYDPARRLGVPRRLHWGGGVVDLAAVKLLPSSRVGRTVYLHFEATDGIQNYELKFNADTQRWTLVDVTLGRES